jgi:hypothetical protein
MGPVPIRGPLLSQALECGPMTISVSTTRVDEVLDVATPVQAECQSATLKKRRFGDVPERMMDVRHR